MFNKKINITELPFEVLAKLGKLIFPKYRFKWHHLVWWENDEFNTFLKRFDNYNKFNDDRLWMLAQLSRLVRNVPGDTAECGVYRGASSFLICKENQASPLEKTHYVFDSFEGLSGPVERDGDHWSEGDLACGIDEVKRNLSDFPNVKYFKGWIPERFPEVSKCQFSLVHIDVDLYQPTQDSFEFFYERVSPGGIIVCDDYGFSACPGAAEAIDSYLATKPEKMLALCSGGGFMVKGQMTGESLYD